MNIRDVTVLSALILSFAVLVTTHVTIAAGLARVHPRWCALVALVVAPLAPYYALREKMRVRAVTWLGAIVLYAAAMIAAR